MDNLVNILQEEIKKNLPETSGKLLKEELERLYKVESYIEEQEKLIKHLQNQVERLQRTYEELSLELTSRNGTIKDQKEILDNWEKREKELIVKENNQPIIVNNCRNAEKTTDKIFELVDKFVTKKRYSTTEKSNSKSDNSNGYDNNSNNYSNNKSNIISETIEKH